MRVRGPAVAAAVMVAALTACGGGPAPVASGPGAGPGPASASPGKVRADDFKSVRTHKVIAAPTRLRIPAIGLSTPPLEALGRDAHKAIELPTRPELAGWFDGGPKPGEPGPAVIIGHVDWDHSPAVFFDLRKMKVGETVYVDRADGSTAEFRVTQVKQVAKAEFPTDEVYAPDLDPSLRLITCGGNFDYAAHNYLDNVIVFASPV